MKPPIRLGPAAVGQRVVVRYRLPGETGPSGGPAMSDVTGTCVEFTEDTCVVQPAEGDPVTIPTDQIVRGKPIPPRPTRRNIRPASTEDS